MATTTKVPTADIDLFSDDVLGNPAPYHNQLRELGPVVYLEKNDVYAVTRYSDVYQALNSPEDYTNTKVAFNPVSNKNLAGTSLASDPPEHTPLRKALMENLGPRSMRKLKTEIFEKADALVRELAQRDSFDGMKELAEAFPVSIVMDLIGLQGEIREKMLPWGEAAFNLLGPLNDRANDAYPLVAELIEWSHHTVKAEDLMEGSLGRGLFAAAERGDIPYESCGLIIHQYIAAGLDTTITSIGNALVLFAQFPDEFQKTRASEDLIPGAFLEVLRFATPAPVLGRGAVRDLDLHGSLIPANSQVALLLGSANMDPRHFENPEEFDVTRNPVDQLGFGQGVHGCAGQFLAKLEAQAVITAWAKYVRSYEVTAVERRLNNFTHPFSRIILEEIEFDPKP